METLSAALSGISALLSSGDREGLLNLMSEVGTYTQHIDIEQ
jgi:hypothetical protein